MSKLEQSPGLPIGNRGGDPAFRAHDEAGSRLFGTEIISRKGGIGIDENLNLNSYSLWGK
jgi:hypothetical protein